MLFSGLFPSELLHFAKVAMLPHFMYLVHEK